MKVIAIDPGYDRVGVAVIEKEQGSKEGLLYSDCITTNKKEGIDQRIAFVADSLSELIEKYSPNYFAIENLFLTTNQKTVMGVAEARGAYKYVAHSLGLPIVEFTPLQIKIAITGYGRSSKDAVSFMIPKLIALPDKKRIDDEVDAIAIGLTFFAHHKFYINKQ
jgi:crossover junction endodeoxyribonuclease RuvC